VKTENSWPPHNLGRTLRAFQISFITPFPTPAAALECEAQVVNLRTPFNFVSTNDYTRRQQRLAAITRPRAGGIDFDGNIQSIRRFEYDESINRSISVGRAGAMLEVLRKISAPTKSPPN